jgi:hypothetical protein
MTASEILQLAIGALQGLTVSSVVVLIIFIGFCVIVGFTKTTRTAGNAKVVKSLDESVTHKPVDYLPPDAPRGPADQLRAPGLPQRSS